MKELVKWFLRYSLGVRLRFLPLSEEAASRWAMTIHRWPAVFKGEDFAISGNYSSEPLVLELGICDVIERSVRCTGTWEPHVVKVYDRLLVSGDTMLDIGANIGVFALMASKRVGNEGRVIAVEAHPKHLGRLHLHRRLNSAENLSIVASAIGEGRQLIEILDGSARNSGAAHIGIAGEGGEGSKNLVGTVSVDELCRDLKNLRLMKIDVEGFEMQALDGAIKTIDRLRPHVLCEVCDSNLRRYGSSAEQLLGLMREHHYEARLLEEWSTEWSVVDDASSIPDTTRDVWFCPREMTESYSV